MILGSSILGWKTTKNLHRLCSNASETINMDRPMHSRVHKLGTFVATGPYKSSSIQGSIAPCKVLPVCIPWDLTEKEHIAKQQQMRVRWSVKLKIHHDISMAFCINNRFSPISILIALLHPLKPATRSSKKKSKTQFDGQKVENVWKMYLRSGGWVGVLAQFLGSYARSDSDRVCWDSHRCCCWYKTSVIFLMTTRCNPPHARRICRRRRRRLSARLSELDRRRILWKGVRWWSSRNFTTMMLRWIVVSSQCEKGEHSDGRFTHGTDWKPVPP